MWAQQTEDTNNRKGRRGLLYLLPAVLAQRAAGYGQDGVSQVIDYSFARPGGAAIRAAGFVGAVRYCLYPGDGGKGLTLAELADLRANGLAVALVFESTAQRPLAGRAAGVFDATIALRNLNTLGFPSDRPCYFAVDFDAQNVHWAAIDEYFRGCASVLGVNRVGAYGGYRTVLHLSDWRLAKWCWQTRAWSWTAKLPERHLYQCLNGQTLNGGAVDYNETNADDWGQWPSNVALEEPMTDDDLLSVFSGSEEAHLPREERLTNARFRRDEAAAGRAPSVRELAASAQAGVPVEYLAKISPVTVTQTAGTILTGEVSIG